VKIIYNIHTHNFIYPKEFDLSKSDIPLAIVSIEIPERWEINPWRYLGFEVKRR
jgi:hypothetical protein